MNILLEQLPTVVEIAGVEYELDTDFRTGLNIMLAFEDTELTIQEKQYVMLQLLFPVIPDDTEQAVEKAIWFLNCGEAADQSAGDSAGRVYSFEKDAKFIYSAFKQTHNIDLETIDYLHWWKFSYMFLDLSEDCFFTRLVYYRSQRARGKLTKEEREYCNRIRNILDLPQINTAEEQQAEQEFLRRLGVR